jgi:hypothetical protein
MHPLSAEQIVQLWELGQGQHPLDRALTCLAFALPDHSLDALATLSIGQRDAYLLMLRELTFGPQMDSQATCPQCQTPLEFSLNTQEIRLIEPSQPVTPAHHWQNDEIQVQFRIPNSLDLAAMVIIEDGALARRTLIERCLLDVKCGEQATALTDLPDTVMTQLGEHIAQADPQADITLDLSCPACGHNWQVLFDIVAFFWSELTAQAQRHLLDVHQLARTYHWRENDILSMSSLRRQFYLNLVS